jgi:menaquinone-dependent protoporphyrinogen oxidase
MRRILIVYGTGHGQTAKIAGRMADLLSAEGESVTIHDARSLPAGTEPLSYDAVIIGASVQFGNHQRHVRRFVRRHASALNALPSAFFSVSGAAASDDPSRRGDAREYVQRFLRESAWEPWLADTMAGAMPYTKYGPFMRWMIRRIARSSGGPTDTSRDHEFTDWSQVEWFIEAFREMVRQPTDPLLAAPV